MGMPEPLQEQDPWLRLSQPRCCTKVVLRRQEGWERMTLQGLYLASRYLFFFFFCIFPVWYWGLCNSSRKIKYK